ncbi:MAG: hypothetical protein A2X84_07415 [Desulfuromonadaceae bacterium GWC2_58_13]|nr:MAG: hypothetical protein A2X84_07415 [Desulfuromonadaceae bacterium GWC2_58_13]
MLDSGFASSPRVSSACLLRQQGYFSVDTITRQLLDALPGILLVLNGQRQIVYANRALLKLIDKDDVSACLGLRPGEVFDCDHAREMPGGCGTAEACGTCGAALATLSGLAGREDLRECRLTRCHNERFEALDLRVEAKPLVHMGEAFVVLAITDISHEKRRQALERIFFHDILNLMGSVRGFAELLQTYNLENRQEIYQLIHEASMQVIDEIEAQRMLLAAESGNLRLQAELIEAEPFLSRLVEIYRYHQVAEGRTLAVAEASDPQPILFNTDRTLLGRILGNMIKNALEASVEGGTVTLSCRRRDDQIEFAVRNAGEMPRSVQLQIFKRYFSTKGEHRGLGTYSMKLLSEYLHGEISFVSAAASGTIFRLRIPILLGPEPVFRGDGVA